MIGVNRPEGVERQKHDYYATDGEVAIPALLSVLGWSEPKLIWENSCGEGHLSEPLLKAGHNVVSTDLIDRGYGLHGVDFLKPNDLLDPIPWDAVIMNPPYQRAQEFVEKSLTHAPTVCAFLRLAFLESEKRRQFYREHPPKYVAVFSKRVKSSKNGLFPKGESSTVAYAWFIWVRGNKEEPKIKWI